MGSRAAQNRGFWRSASETAYDSRPRIVDVTDQQPEAALARSFLAGLPPEVTRELQAEGERADYPAGTGVQAVEASSLFRISARMLTAAARRDPRVCWAIAEELNRRLYEVLEQTAVNAFGSVRQRVSAHLLDLASAQQEPAGRLAASRSRSWPTRSGRSARWWPGCCASCGSPESSRPRRTAS